MAPGASFDFPFSRQAGAVRGGPLEQGAGRRYTGTDVRTCLEKDVLLRRPVSKAGQHSLNSKGTIMVSNPSPLSSWLGLLPNKLPHSQAVGEFYAWIKWHLKPWGPHHFLLSYFGVSWGHGKP